MKKFLLVAALAVSSLGASAQNKASFGMVGNVNFSRLRATVNTGGSSESGNSGTLIGFSAGLFADLNVGNNFSIRPSLLYTVKGFKETADDVMIDETNTPSNMSLKFNLNYLELPLNVVYHVPVKIGELQFGMGPYIGYGLSAKATAKQGNTSASQDIEFGNTEDTFKRTDFGLNVLMGLRLQNKLMINVGSDLGLANLSNTEGAKLRNQTFSAGVGFAF